MPEHKVGTQQEFDAARQELLAEEKELTATSQRRARVRPVRDEAGAAQSCCSSLCSADVRVESQCGRPSWRHARNVTMLLVSRGPVETLEAYRQRMGWSLEWVSAGAGEFNRDMGFTHTEEELRPFLGRRDSGDGEALRGVFRTDVAGYVTEAPGLSVYALSDGRSTGPTSPPRAVSSRRWPTTACSIGRRWDATRPETLPSGCAGTTSTRPADGAREVILTARARRWRRRCSRA